MRGWKRWMASSFALQRLASLVVIVLLLLLPKKHHTVSLAPLDGGKQHILSPTTADRAFDQWCNVHGIYRVGVQTITDQKRSLGGRGVFCNVPVLTKNSVVASIPAPLVLVEDNENNNKNKKQEWLVSLVNQIMARKKDNDEWMQSWNACGTMAMEKLLMASNKEKAMEELFLADMGKGCITRQGAMTELRTRVENYQRRLEHLDTKDDDIARWYSLVLSRAAYLGKDWDYKVGVVPFFDMLNHCHNASMANTELMTFGDYLDRTAAGGGASDEPNPGLQRKDLLLVLTQDVAEGEELLTQYETDVESEKANYSCGSSTAFPLRFRCTGATYWSVHHPIAARLQQLLQA